MPYALFLFFQSLSFCFHTSCLVSGYHFNTITNLDLNMEHRQPKMAPFALELFMVQVTLVRFRVEFPGVEKRHRVNKSVYFACLRMTPYKVFRPQENSSCGKTPVCFQSTGREPLFHRYLQISLFFFSLLLITSPSTSPHSIRSYTDSSYKL